LNPLDAAIFVLVVAATVGGYQLGFAARLLAWAGVAVGLAVGAQFVARVVTAFGGDRSDGRFTVAALFLLMTASAGQGLGLTISRFVPREARPRPRYDRVAGSVLGGGGVLVLVWMLTPSLVVARFAALGRAVADAPYPAALAPFTTPADPGPPPVTTLSAAVDAAIRPSTVEVEGVACRRIQEGSGWVVAPGLVVTNAHVVAGERETHLLTVGGATVPAEVVAFDPDADLALLSVPELKAPPLPMASPKVGMVGAVYGHPHGGSLKVVPARIAQNIVAVGTDIYRTSSSRRHVLVLATSLQPGDSGGALVDSAGSVVGVAFATDPGQQHTGYALTSDQVRAVLAHAGSTPVATGSCLVD
jgi:S1-C subfamily serine protease